MIGLDLPEAQLATVFATMGAAPYPLVQVAAEQPSFADESLLRRSRRQRDHDPAPGLLRAGHHCRRRRRDQLTYGDWTKVLRGAGLVTDGLIEPRPTPATPNCEFLAHFQDVGAGVGGELFYGRAHHIVLPSFCVKFASEVPFRPLDQARPEAASLAEIGFHWRTNDR
ncbi:hypothetical protein [Streptomyces bauhiniae]|uniref:hypothetical protein n=1 Tax=Streptomyces bauhiniae TaxID=2340725 RepID=UPI0035DCDD31